MISMMPDQRHSTPAMDRLSSTAFWAPERAASETASIRPVAAPNSRERMTIPPQIHDIAIEISSFYQECTKL